MLVGELAADAVFFVVSLVPEPAFAESSQLLVMMTWPTDKMESRIDKS